MSNKELNSVEQGSTENHSSLNQPGSRRKFFKKAALGSALITTMASRPAWGTNTCTVSGKLSGNLSHQADLDECIGYGFSPGGWKNFNGNPSDWPSPLSSSEGGPSLTLASLNNKDNNWLYVTSIGQSIDITGPTGDANDLPVETLHTLLTNGTYGIHRRFVQGLLNTMAYNANWYRGPSSSVGSNLFPFLADWPYTIDELITAYNTNNTAIFNDIADKEY
jgi:hypothetical protein